MSNFENNPYAVSNVNDDEAGFQYGEQPVKVPDYLALSIIATVFGCTIFGIIAIIYAAQANSSKQRSAYQLALQQARKAKIYMIVAFVFAIPVYIFQIVNIIVLTTSAPH